MSEYQGTIIKHIMRMQRMLAYEPKFQSFCQVLNAGEAMGRVHLVEFKAVGATLPAALVGLTNDAGYIAIADGGAVQVRPAGALAVKYFAAAPLEFLDAKGRYVALPGGAVLWLADQVDLISKNLFNSEVDGALRLHNCDLMQDYSVATENTVDPTEADYWPLITMTAVYRWGFHG